MKPTYDVRIWDIKKMVNRRRPYGVRWITAGKEHSKWFVTKPLAKKFLSQLVQATNKGEAFDVETGLPEGLYRKEHSPTLVRVAREFLEHVWPDMAPNSRGRLVDGLAVAVQGFLTETPSVEPADVRRALTTYVLPPAASKIDPTPEFRQLADWIESHSRKVAELADDEARTELGRYLRRNLDGSTAKPNTINTRRRALVPALGFAVRREYLAANPMVGVKLVNFGEALAIDPRFVVSPTQARELLTAATYVRPRGRNRSWPAFFATLYYGGLRPGEARSLADVHCKLPDKGWGEIVLPNSLGRSAPRYSDIGARYELRPLKHRSEDHRRVIPIPPRLVQILTDHIEEKGLAQDGRLFRAGNGEPVSNGSWTDIWRLTRPLALTPADLRFGLAETPYTLRHAAVSSWIAAGVPLPDVAERAGHSVEMLTRVYAKFVHGTRDTSNRRIEEFLGDDDEE